MQGALKRSSDVCLIALLAVLRNSMLALLFALLDSMLAFLFALLEILGADAENPNP